MNITEQIAVLESIPKSKAKKLDLVEALDLNFTLPNEIIPQLFQTIKNDYLVLKYGDKPYRTFKTLYFDTNKNKDYIAAHNGKRNRQLVRFKHCIETESTFLEVKYLNKKGRYKKRRLKVDKIKAAFSEEEIKFLKKAIPKKKILKLQPRLAYHFKRVLMANKNGEERITLDSDIEFIYNGTEVQNPKFSFVQIRVERYSNDSRFLSTLKELGLRKGQIGKYVFGMSIFGDQKANLFAKKTDRINKIIASYD